jgi:hypothetical protein
MCRCLRHLDCVVIQICWCFLWSVQIVIGFKKLGIVTDWQRRKCYGVRTFFCNLLSGTFKRFVFTTCALTFSTRIIPRKSFTDSLVSLFFNLLIYLRYFCWFCLPSRSVIVFLFFTGTYSHGIWLWLLVMYIVWFLVCCYLTFILVLLRKCPAYFIVVCGWKLQLWQYFCFKLVRNLRRGTVNFLMSVRLSAWGNAAATGRISIKFVVWLFFENLWRKIQV